MNKETLIEKLDNWTLAGAQKFYNFVALPELITVTPILLTLGSKLTTEYMLYQELAFDIIVTMVRYKHY